MHRNSSAVCALRNKRARTYRVALGYDYSRLTIPWDREWTDVLKVTAFGLEAATPLRSSAIHLANFAWYRAVGLRCRGRPVDTNKAVASDRGYAVFCDLQQACSEQTAWGHICRTLFPPQFNVLQVRAFELEAAAEFAATVLARRRQRIE